MRRVAPLISLLLLLTPIWGQSMRGGHPARVERGNAKVSALPAFSAEELAEGDPDEKAPTHNSVPDFPLPASHRPILPAIKAKTTATTGGATALSGVSRPTSAIATPAEIRAAAASFSGLSSPSPAV